MRYSFWLDRAFALISFDSFRCPSHCPERGRPHKRMPFHGDYEAKPTIEVVGSRKGRFQIAWRARPVGVLQYRGKQARSNAATLHLRLNTGEEKVPMRLGGMPGFEASEAFEQGGRSIWIDRADPFFSQRLAPEVSGGRLSSVWWPPDRRRHNLLIHHGRIDVPKPDVRTHHIVKEGSEHLGAPVGFRKVILEDRVGHECPRQQGNCLFHSGEWQPTNDQFHNVAPA